MFATIAAYAEKPQNCTFGLGNDNVSRFTQHWYSEQLFALGESCLPAMGSPNPIYRFLWLRTFHHPFVVRLEVQQDGTGKIIAREADGAGGYKPGKITSTSALPVSKEKVDEFLKRLDAANFFGDRYPDHRGMDGAEWIVEFADKTEYKMQLKWTPDESDPFRAACLYLFSLSDFGLPKDVY